MTTPSKSMTERPTRWALSVRFFHWTSGLLLVAVWAMIFVHENTEDADDLYISLHKALGVSFLCWIMARFINRLSQKNQLPAPVAGPRWQQLSAGLVHSFLYVTLLLMPLAGLLMTQYKGYTTNMFGLFEIPLFVVPDRHLSHFFQSLHTDILWPLILALTAAHVLAALFHQFVKKDRTINRML
jgi:cytochrome b561